MRRSFLLLLAGLAACDGGPTGTKTPQPAAGITAVSGHDATDTVGALQAAPLTIRVLKGSPAVPAGGVAVTFEATRGREEYTPFCTDCTIPTLWMAGLAADVWEASATATTSADGTVAVRVWFGRVAGQGKIVVRVPELGMQDTVVYTIRPGSAARVLLMPRDTALFAGSAFTARAVVLDRWGNARPEVPALSATGLGVSGLSVTGTRYGAQALRGSHQGIQGDSMRVDVVPRGTIAQVFAGSMSKLATVNLDRTGASTLDLGMDVAGYDWVRGGAAMVASLHDRAARQHHLYRVSLETGTRARLAIVGGSELDSQHNPQLTADGQWVYFVGTLSNGRTRLYRVKLDGTGLEAIRDVAASSSSPHAHSFAVSPDGRQVVTGDLGGVVLTDVASRSSRLIHTGSDPLDLRWSPDGQRIALGSNTQVLVFKADGTEPRVVASRSYPFDRTVGWSPDSRWLVYAGAHNAEIAEVATGTTVGLAFLSSVRMRWKP